MTARLLTTADPEEWERALPASVSAFGSVGFARAQRGVKDAESCLLVSDNGVATPLVLRSIEGSDLRDATTPSFTGPLVTGSSPDRSEGDALLAAEGIVAEFNHIHTWRQTADVGAQPDREIVWVDTSLEPDELWRDSYSKACRKNVKRSEREGVEVRAAESADDIAEFHRIYTLTMDRNEALEGYYFDEGYFQAIYEEMPDTARFAMAEHDGKVIAATLYLHDAEDVYSYLGGADHAHQDVRPTNAAVHQTIEWARGAGKKRLILGGGYTPDDGIFRFKASFSPERATLDLARRVHDQPMYNQLVSAWRKRGGGEDTGYFPLYRQPV